MSTNWTKEQLDLIAMMESSLCNDEASSDTELMEFFTSNGIKPETASLAVAQRDKALVDMEFQLNTKGMVF
jgi:hypothetical protein